MWSTGAGLQKGQRGLGKVLPGLQKGEATVRGVGMGRRGQAKWDANGGVSGVGKGVSGGDEGVQGGVAGGEEGGREGVEECGEGKPFVASDSRCGCARLCGVVGGILLGQHQNPTLWITCGLYKGTQRF